MVFRRALRQVPEQVTEINVKVFYSKWVETEVCIVYTDMADIAFFQGEAAATMKESSRSPALGFPSSNNQITEYQGIFSHSCPFS